MTNLPADLSLETLLSDLPEFRPLAYYDKHLDAIRVQIRDCSIWEERHDRIMSIYHDNYFPKPDGSNDIVGFSIKGVRHLLNQLDLPHTGAIKLAQLLDELVRLYPTSSTKRVVEFYRELGTGVPDEVVVPLAA